ncbi:MAG: hypothetical protein Kow0092_29210 [Deferrisomatales bacterium]
MGRKRTDRFLFLGGVPVFDYLITVGWDEIAGATGGKAARVGRRILLPVGTVFRIRVADPPETLCLNPLANREPQTLHDRLYYSLELGGKHPPKSDLSLCADEEQVFRELHAAYPQAVPDRSALRVVEVAQPAHLNLGGNNKNILQTLRTLYDSPELAEHTRRFSFEHTFFFDTADPRFPLVESLYEELGVGFGDRESVHVAGLAPRVGYVLTLVEEDGQALDRIILANRTNEEVIPPEKLRARYFDLEYRLRKDADFVATHLVINSMTNPEELRLVARLLQTAYASGVTTYLCPTLTLIRAVDRMLEAGYYTTQKERFFQYRHDFLHTAVLPYVRYLILNREELGLVDAAVDKKGIDATAGALARIMNRGRTGDGPHGGRVIVTGGSKGVRYTERLEPDRAARFWRKAGLPDDRRVRYADRRIVCGDDYVTDLRSTLGAGDVFTGVFVGLNALGWDGGHALRAATLGAQHFIQSRRRPRIADMVAVDESHIRMGTETELVDVISHHVDQSGAPTRYGTIADTVITIRTTQIHHPFREVLALAGTFGDGQAKAPRRPPARPRAGR